MWPWGHVAFGYLLYSLGGRVAGLGSPQDRPVVVLVIATQLPDLVDKPLSWGLDVFPSGYAVGHSVLVALPLGVLVLLAGRSRNASAESTAFVVGYWSHLLGDLAIATVRRGEVTLEILLWPIVTLPPYANDYGLVGRIRVYATEFVEEFANLGESLLLLLLLYVAPVGFAGLLWVIDGCPGLAGLTRRRAGSLRARK